MLIREATQDDNAELMILQAACPQGTTLIVSTVNIPDFFSRSKIYENCKVYVAVERNKIIGSAACAVRDVIIGGETTKVGYEFQAFVDPEYRGKRIAGQLTKAREEYLRKQEAVLSYGLIMEGNKPSIKHIERQGFKRHQTILMPSVPVFKELPTTSKANIRPALPEDLTAIASLLNISWKGYQLYEPATVESLGRMFNGTNEYSLKDLLVLEENGEIAACMGLWDWGKIMRITVKALSVKMRLMNLFIDAMRIFKPLPKGPRAGDVLRQAVITAIGFKDPEYLPLLFPYINNLALAKGIQQIFFLSDSSHPMLNVLKGFLHIDTSMHLYIKTLIDNQSLSDEPVYVSGLDM